MIKYPFALDSNDAAGKLVSTADACKKQDYFCIICKGRMRLAGGKGTQKQLYFFHNDPGIEHPGETFLHDYVKRYIAELFLKADKFEIQYYVEEICCKEICRFDRRMCKKRKLSNKYDLKKYYDKVEIEKHLDNDFQPDVYLTSEKHPQEPIFIEIEVTHACSEEKKNLGTRIIEIKLPKNYDIEKHPLKLDCLKEGNMGNGIEVKFHNFNKNRQQISKEAYGGKDIHVIALKKNGSIGYFFNNIDCAAYGTKICKDSIKEVHLAMGNYNRTTISFKAIANLYGIPCKNCRFCPTPKSENGWYKKKLECSYTKKEIKYGSEAEKCPHYFFSRYEALTWALRINESAYIVVDKDGNYVWPIDVQAEYEKAEDEMRETMYELYEEEVKSRELEEENRKSEEYTDPDEEYSVYEEVNSGNLEKKIRDFEEEIKFYAE